MRIHSDILPDVLVRYARLPRSRVMQTIRQLKAAGRISAGRPYAPPIVAKDVARLVLGLASPSSGRAPEFERDVGGLRGPDGTAEAALVNIIETGQFEGQIAVAHSFVEVRTPSSVHLYGEVPVGAVSLVVIPISAVHSISKEIINV